MPHSGIFHHSIYVLAFVVCFFCSCKKEYNCHCVTTTNGVSVKTDRSVTMRKKDAIETCEAQSAKEDIQGVATVTKCEIR